MITGDWFILRCTAQNTIPLVRSLNRAGYEVWTPVERKTKRVPRANIKRVIDYAMMPTYIFAKAQHLVGLVDLANAQSKEHRDFRVFHHNGGIPLIGDDCLQPVRMLERKSFAAASTAQFKKGDKVKLMDGGFAGLTVMVESVGVKDTIVTLPGFSGGIKVANYYLLQNTNEHAIRAA